MVAIHQCQMRGYHHLFLALMPTRPSTWTSQGNLMPPFHSSVNPSIGPHSTSSSHVEEIQSATPDSREVESLFTPTVSNTVESKDDDESKTHNTMHTEAGNSIKEPKLRMVFKSK